MSKKLSGIPHTSLRLDRRQFSAGLAGLTALGAPSVARAQAGWPKNGTIRLIIPFPPAGATDVIGRIVAEKLSQAWGTQVVIENRAGAGGNIGSDAAAKSSPDGTTMVVGSVGFATNPYLYKSLPYDPVKDFEPVSLMAMVPNLLVVPNSSPAKTVAEFVALAKASGDKITFASSGIGTSVHLSGELFNKLAGAKMTHLPYKGAGETKNDLIAGRFDCIFDNITSILPLVQGGQARALGITTARRSRLAPNIPPVADAVPGFDVSSWFGIFVPTKTPAEIINKMSADIRTALSDQAVAEKLGALGGEIVASTPAELGAHLRREGEKWGALIKEIGASAG
jgi:tripartite-type tricarboxylate transporter receptor subunit TctC